jgi:hypothetical protein
MSIFNLFGSSCHVDSLYSDTNDDGDEDAYLYRLESDGNSTPVSKNSCNDDDYQADDDTGDEPENVNPWLGWFGL